MDKSRYRRGAHTVTELKYHFVWKTKYSYPVLRGDLGLRFRELLREICREKGLEVVKGNIRANHVHVLVSAPTDCSPAKIAQYLKGKSSYSLQREFPWIRKKYWGQHLWARGYFCTTVGAVNEEQVKAYIEEQDDEPNTIHVWDEKRLESDSSEDLK